MSKGSRITVAVSAFCFATSMAAAADLQQMPVKAAPVPYVAAAPYYDWSGFYIGGFAGGTHGVWTSDFERSDNHGHTEQSANGFTTGLYGGFNYQFASRFVLGGELDVGTSTAMQDNRIYDNDTSLTKYGTFGSARARVGYAFDRLLVFGTVGVAFGQLTNDIQKGENAGEQIVWEDKTRVGFTTGGGIEYALTNHLVARAEYVYTNYGTATLYNTDGNRANFKNETHLFRVGASYHFN